MTIFWLCQRLRPCLLWLVATMFTTAVSAQLALPGSKAVVITEQVRAELLAYAPQGVVAGQPIWLGLQLKHQPGWHTYWKNSGDSGLPTQLEWTLPTGLFAGEIAWPLPKKLPLGNLINYGYEGTVLLPVPLTLTPDFQAGPLTRQLSVKLRASWLVCRTECIPEEGEFALDIPLHGSTAMHRAAFDSALAAQPSPLPQSPNSRVTIAGEVLEISVNGLPPGLQGRRLEAFPELAEVINPSAPWQQAWQGAIWTARLPISEQRSNSPSALALVITHQDQGWRAELPIRGEWPQVVPRATVSPALQAALESNAAQTLPAASASFVAALIGAILGGLVLNLMPCVFPVLAIKVLSFTRHAEDRRSHRISGMSYTLGVISSFVALGVLMLSLRALGESLGWGFHLQNPLVVSALAVLFTVIGLNLAGLFEFGQFAPTSLASLQARHPVIDSFLTGVLAVAVASPCTAPFMGASLGLAVTLPTFQALLIFAALGIGLSLPFLAASFIPAIATVLPRPGAWMQTFRQFLAFPMFMTVIWMVWVLGHQNGIDGAGALLSLLLTLSAVIWSFTLAGRMRMFIATAMLLLMGAGMWGLGSYLLPGAGPTVQATDPATPTNSRWQPWAPGRVEQLTAQGQTVFVDFTAAWCVTCQYNKQTTLTDAGVLADFDAKRIILMRADWTRRDPAISAALAQLGRSGVPVYVFYKQGMAPIVLSEILTVSDVRSALSRL